MATFRSESIDRLFEVILGLGNVEDCYNFFEDICTINELQDMAQRMDVAILLDKGKNYQEIAKEVSVSTATISRVSRCLNYGSGGYKAALAKLNGQREEK